MNNISKTKKLVLFLMIMGLAGSVITLIFLSMYGNTDQSYNDIIAEYTAIIAGNKSVEINLLFVLIFIGMIIYFIFFCFVTKKQCISEKMGSVDIESDQKSNEFLAILASMIAVFLVIFNGTHQIVVMSLLYAVILYVVNKESVYTGVCLFYLITYALVGLYRLFVFLGGVGSINVMMLAIGAFSICTVPLFCKDTRNKMIKFGMLGECFIPLILLVYLSNKYNYIGTTVIINVPKRINIFIVFFILLFIIEAIYKLKKNWSTVDKIDDAITFGSCVAVMAFNRFDGTGAIMSTDLHHPFENIIGFQQIFKLGQTPFSDYIPVSGMYSIFQGAVLDFFGDGGTFSNYYVTNNLFYFLVIIPIVLLMIRQIDRSYVFILSLIIYIQSYNRLAFMLPIMLLLVYPKLIEKKNAWLMTWFLTSLFQGLYYPLYGAAVCIAFFPLGIWQMVTFIKSKELMNNLKSMKFWFGWAICAVILILCSGCLIGTIKHTLAMSGQSVLAYGIPRFGQLVPTWFLSYLGNTSLATALRICLWYVLTFMIPVVFVWIMFAFTLKAANISFWGKKIRVGDIKTACIIISVVIMPIICYTFTFIRLDIDNVYARAASVLLTGMVLALIFVWNYLDHSRLKIFLSFIMISIPVLANMVGIFTIETNSKLSSFYNVPDGYMYVNDDEVEKIGTGFIEKGVYESIKSTHAKFVNRDKSCSYMGDPSLFGYFYLLDIRGDGAMELADTVKSLSAAEETIHIARANKSIIAPSFFAPYYNYYLYHWLLTSGEYVWDVAEGVFIPNDNIYTREEILERHKNINISQEGLDCGKIAGAWGASIDSLEQVFTNPEIKYNMIKEGNHVKIDFNEIFDGDMADFLYLQFADMDKDYEYILFDLYQEVSQQNSVLGKFFMKKNYNPNMTVRIDWEDDSGAIHTMNCKMCKGKLLIPIGTGQGWLLNCHNYISIAVYKDGNEVEIPQIVDINLLKLREVH